MSFFEKSVPTPVSLSKFNFFGGMPSTMLSIFSIVTLGAVFFFLWQDILLRTLFQIPDHLLQIIIIISMVLSVIIMLVCAKRPGGLWYRYWNIFLVILNSIFFVLYFLPANTFNTVVANFIDSSLFDIIVCTIAAATFVLLPRLIRLSVNSWWLSRISFVSLVVVLSMTVFSVYFGQAHILDQTKNEVLSVIEKIKREAKIIQDSQNQKEIEVIDPLLFDPILWRNAKIFALDQALSAALTQKITAVNEKIAKLRNFNLKDIADPAIYYDENKKSWIHNRKFPESAKKIITYFEFVRSLLATIKPSAMAFNPQSEHLESLYYAQKNQFKQFIDQLKDSWLNSVLYERFSARKKLDLAYFLETSIIKSKQQAKAANPWYWLSMTLSEAKKLQKKSTGCRFSEYEAKKKTYFRMDCYAYADITAKVVTPLIEIRIVYAERYLHETTTPTELYYIFPLPKEKSADNYMDDIINVFITQINNKNPNVSIKNTRSSAKEGVSLIQQGKKIVVYRLKAKDYFKQQQMIELRMVKRY